MKTYFESVLTEYDFPKESREVLSDALNKLSQYGEFLEIVENYYGKENNTDAKAVIEKYKVIKEILTPICEKENLHYFIATAVMQICVSKETKAVCKEWNWTDDMFHRAMLDVRCKLVECYDNYGVWGIYVASWIGYIFAGIINSIGRLQFMYRDYEDDGEVVIAGKTLSRGVKYIDIHIPASDEPFDEKTRLESYEAAYRYFKELYGDEPCFFGCKSWLLFGHNHEILSPKSNIISFMNEFKLVKTEFYSDNRFDMWRIFGGIALTADFEDLPENSSLQRGYKKWLVNGNFPGEGKGYFVYDSVNKKIFNE